MISPRLPLPEPHYASWIDDPGPCTPCNCCALYQATPPVMKLVACSTCITLCVSPVLIAMKCAATSTAALLSKIVFPIASVSGCLSHFTAPLIFLKGMKCTSRMCNCLCGGGQPKEAPPDGEAFVEIRVERREGEESPCSFISDCERSEGSEQIGASPPF